MLVYSPEFKLQGWWFKSHAVIHVILPDINLNSTLFISLWALVYFAAQLNNQGNNVEAFNHNHSLSSLSLTCLHSSRVPFPYFCRPCFCSNCITQPSVFFFSVFQIKRHPFDIPRLLIDQKWWDEYLLDPDSLSEFRLNVFIHVASIVLLSKYCCCMYNWRGSLTPSFSTTLYSSSAHNPRREEIYNRGWQTIMEVELGSSFLPLLGTARFNCQWKSIDWNSLQF